MSIVKSWLSKRHATHFEACISSMQVELSRIIFHCCSSNRLCGLLLLPKNIYTVISIPKSFKQVTKYNSKESLLRAKYWLSLSLSLLLLLSNSSKYSDYMMTVRTFVYSIFTPINATRYPATKPTTN